MFNAWAAVRNLTEIVATQFLLFLKAERTVVGGDHLEIVSAQSFPKLFLIRLVPERRGHDILCAFEPVLLVIGVIQEQILRACFRKRGKAHVTGSLNLS